MAEERDDAQRTEEPTQKRLDDAAQKGDVVKSQELSSFIVVLGGALALAMFANSAAKQFIADFLIFLENPAQMPLDGGSAAALFHKAVFAMFGLLAPATGLLMLFGLAGHMVQNRPNISLERLKPDFGKLSLIKGAKRLFGFDGVVNIVKGILKILLVGAASCMAIWPYRGQLAASLDMNPVALAGLALMLIGKVLVAALIVLAMIAGADYFYQRHRFFARHRMTRQELKDEVKQSEGDPQVKAKIRQIRMERSQRRMIAAIPQATVVIANPTHYAVALKYESGKMGAPVCVAKGVDHLALTIRKVAEEHGIPVVENPPLARALHAAVEVDGEIPAEHYKAVAQVIGYVLRLTQKSKFWRD